MIYFDKNKEAYSYEIKNYVATVDDNVWEKYAGTAMWDIVDGKFQANEEELHKQRRIEEINLELERIDKEYLEEINTPIMYENGFNYKPKYVQESYVLILSANLFPVIIWDSDEMNPLKMTKEELMQLSLFLKERAEGAFQARKMRRKFLIEELREIEQNN